MNFEKEPFIFRAVPWLIGIVFVVMFCFWVGVAYLLTKVGDEVGTNGLKAVIESVWCGKQGCK